MRNLIKIGMWLIAVTLSSFAHAAEPGVADTPRDSLTFSLFFRLDDDLLLRNYRSNEQALNRIDQLLNTITEQQMKHICIIGSASPDGNELRNRELAQRRACAIGAYIRWKHPQVDLSCIQTSFVSDFVPAWLQVVEQDLNVPRRDKVLEILQSEASVATKWANIQLLVGGPAEYMEKQLFPPMRNAVSCVIVFNKAADATRELSPEAPTAAATGSKPQGLYCDATATGSKSQGLCCDVAGTVRIAEIEPQASAGQAAQTAATAVNTATSGAATATQAGTTSTAETATATQAGTTSTAKAATTTSATAIAATAETATATQAAATNVSTATSGAATATAAIDATAETATATQAGTTSTAKAATTTSATSTSTAATAETASETAKAATTATQAATSTPASTASTSTPASTTTQAATAKTATAKVTPTPAPRAKSAASRAEKPLMALKTNLLFDALTILNIGVEVPIGPRWSVAGEWMFPWWIAHNKQHALQVMSGTVEGKYWFGNRQRQPDGRPRQQLTGWFAGIYAGGGYYDLEWNHTGYQGEFFIAAGVSGGYAHTINKQGNLRMEYSLGIGYMQTDYRKYEAQFGADNKWHLYRRANGKYQWFGPTSLKVSLVWMLNHKQKGGSK